MASIGSSILPLVEITTPFHTEGVDIAVIPGGQVTVFSFTVPAGVTRKLSELKVNCESPGKFILESGGLNIASGYCYEAEKNIVFKFDPMRPISGGALIELKYFAESEPNPGCPVSGYLSANDLS